jgi:CO/xanthine dehydrogenase Mo-binding subunit
VLLQLAAERLQVPRERLSVREGEVRDQQNPDTKVTYAQLTQGQRIERHLEGEVSLKPYAQHTLSGKATGRTDAKQKVTGEARYTGDVRLPGLLYARILRPPAHGARLKSVDTTAAQKVEGVQVLRDGDLVAILHEYPDVAEKALGQVQAEYELPEPTVDHDHIFQHLLDVAAPGEVVTSAGNLEEGQKLARQTFESTYLNHYVAHAPLEPHTALVQMEGEKATVWASTQSPFGAREEVARTLGFPAQNVRVITPFVGGGFGGKTRHQQVVEAARLAKLAGRPVQVAWSRPEEFFYDTFRPAAVIQVRSGLNEEHRIVYWDYDNFFAGTRSSQPFYDLPHYRVMSRGGGRGDAPVHPFGTGAWRGPGSNTNVFAMESQIDLMAAAAGLDPLEFRRRNLKNPRMERVLQAAAERFGAQFAPAPSGRGYGIACTDYLGTYVTTMAEVRVDQQTGQVRVERVVCAQDMGEVINPEGARIQIEGGITMGLGYVLSEGIRFQGGKVLDQNFDTYELPRFSWLPRLETVLIDNPDLPPQGCGEPAITTMGAVIANAVYDAIGVRLFELPLTPERIKKVLPKN